MFYLFTRNIPLGFSSETYNLLKNITLVIQVKHFHHTGMFILSKTNTIEKYGMEIDLDFKIQLCSKFCVNKICRQINCKGYATTPGAYGY